MNYITIFSKEQPLNREAADLVVFLASDLSGWITGANDVIDGSARKPVLVKRKPGPIRRRYLIVER